MYQDEVARLQKDLARAMMEERLASKALKGEEESKLRARRADVCLCLVTMAADLQSENGARAAEVRQMLSIVDDP